MISKYHSIFKLANRMNWSSRQIATSVIRLSNDASDKAMLREFSQKFLGARKVDFTQQMTFLDSANDDAIPIYRIMGVDGKFFDSSQDPDIPRENLVKIYQQVCYRIKFLS